MDIALYDPVAPFWKNVVHLVVLLRVMMTQMCTVSILIELFLSVTYLEAQCL